MTVRTYSATAAVLALAALAVAGCSSSASTPAASTTGGIGAPLPSSALPSATSSAPLGQPIHRGDLTITISGPPRVRADGAGLDVTFDVTMTNTGHGAAVAGPAEFGVRCDANRGDGPGGWLTSTTAAHKTIPAGRTVTGTAVVQWVGDNAVTQCTGPTTIEADWTGTQFLAWTIPPAEVATVNAGAPGSSSSATPAS